MKYDVVIIGSGLGGLLCGNILSNEGLNVCIIEKNNRLGGSLQSFKRKGTFFNTGLNYTESLDKGQILYQYFRYFGLLDKLNLKRLDENGFDVISFNDGKYKLAMGHLNFRDSLLEHFPKEKQGLTKYLEKIRNICLSNPLYDLSDKLFDVFSLSSMSIGAADFIQSEISDYRLQNVIAGNNLMYAGHRNKTPLLIHALISNSFIESAWRVGDGTDLMIDILAKNVTDKGGTILKNARAEAFVQENYLLKCVQLDTGEQIEGKYFISNIHPEHLVSMSKTLKISRLFSFHISRLEDTIGMFTLYLVFKKNTFPYLNYNLYHYNQDNVWIAGDYNPSKWPQMFVFMSTATSKSEYYAESASVLTYLQYGELEQWKDTITGKRGKDYLEFKKKKEENLLKAVEKQFPGITSCIDSCFSSTPLTWRDYTGSRAGSAYGVLKDFNRPMESIILPKTKIRNLFLTGQNTNVHGILGVTISSVITCGEILDLKYLVRKIRDA